MIWGRRGSRVATGDVFAGELWALVNVNEVRFASFSEGTLH